MKKKFKHYQFLTLLLFINLSFFSCNNEPILLESENTVNNNLPQEFDTVEMAFPNIQGKVVTIQLNGETVEVEKINDEYILGGDMIVVPDAKSQSSKSTGRTSARWPNNTVYYSIESSLPNQKRVTDAIAHWESNTFLTFVKRTDQSAYVNFRDGSGCSSSVGRTGGKQNITLGSRCSTGSAIHEIGHAVGLWHEQSRSDRSNFIIINYDNIESGRDHNFRTYAERGRDGAEYTETFDFSSIMMYHPKSFSKNGLPTITRKDGSSYNVQRSILSNGDKQGIAIMYPSNNEIISFKGNNNRYISSENGGKAIAVNRTRIGSFERFELIRLDNGKVAFKGNNNRYISSENGVKPMICNRPTIGSWEQFTLISKGGDKYNIKGNNGRYVSSNGGDDRGVTCDRVNARSFELFTISGL